VRSGRQGCAHSPQPTAHTALRDEATASKDQLEFPNEKAVESTQHNGAKRPLWQPRQKCTARYRLTAWCADHLTPDTAPYGMSMRRVPDVGGA